MSHHEEGGTCACGGNCGCNSEQQVYLTKEEYIAELEKYLVRLRQEIESVEQELHALRETA